MLMSYVKSTCATDVVFCTVGRERSDRLDCFAYQKMQKNMEKKISH
jgi:hypothetical protein